MKRFLIFAGDTYYPIGGWKDFRGSADTIDEAADMVYKIDGMVDWFHVVDSQTGRVIFDQEGKCVYAG